MHRVLLSKLIISDGIGWPREALDNFSSLSSLGGEATKPNPTDRFKLNTKHHAIVDGYGSPTSTATTEANRHDTWALMSLIKSLSEVAGKANRPQRYPKQLFGHRAHDSDPLRGVCKAQRNGPQLAKRNTMHDNGPVVFRWLVEHTL